MKLNTTRFGSIEISEEQLIWFPRGLPGFEELQRFVVIDRGANSAFKWLQAVDAEDVAFLLADPHRLVPGYRLNTLPPDSAILGLDKDFEHLAIAVIVTVPNGAPEKMTVNLRAPVLFNNERRLGVQVILGDSTIPLRYPVIEGLRKIGSTQQDTTSSASGEIDKTESALSVTPAAGTSTGSAW